MNDNEKQELEKEIIKALKTVHDPEIPVNIYDLGLIYEINIDNNNFVEIVMTLTNPNCPVADSMPNNVKNVVKNIEGVNDVIIKLVFEPQWSLDLISDAAKLDMGLL